jgi:hypothetical protein
MNYGKWWSSPRKACLAVFNWCIVGMGFAIMGIGLYASGKAIHDDGGNGSWSCADNSM